LIPKFANECAAQWCELRNRDTRAWSRKVGTGFRKRSCSAKRPRFQSSNHFDGHRRDRAAGHASRRPRCARAPQDEVRGRNGLSSLIPSPRP